MGLLQFKSSEDVLLKPEDKRITYEDYFKDNAKANNIIFSAKQSNRNLKLFQLWV